MANLRKPVIKRNTPEVLRLNALATLIDELHRDLDRVDFLGDDIVDKQKFKHVQEQKKKADAALKRVRDAIASKGGKVVAKGYK